MSDRKPAASEPEAVGAEAWGDELQVLDPVRTHAHVINLETSVTTSEHAARKSIHYRKHPGNLPLLGAARIDCCTLANNQ